MEEILVTRWDHSSPPKESDLREFFRREGLTPSSWSNPPGDRYQSHEHPYHKVIYVLRGSITWVLPDDETEIETSAGDRIDLPAGVEHAAIVGNQGVTCLEAHWG